MLSLSVTSHRIAAPPTLLATSCSGYTLRPSSETFAPAAPSSSAAAAPMPCASEKSRKPPKKATSAVLAVVAWPFVRGYGRQPGNPSLLPRNYAAGLVVYLAAIWTVALAIVGVGLAVRAVRRSRSNAEPPSEELNA